MIIYWCGSRFTLKEMNARKKTDIQNLSSTTEKNQNLKEFNVIKIFCQNIDFCAKYRTCDSFGNKQQRVDSIGLKRFIKKNWAKNI